MRRLAIVIVVRFLLIEGRQLFTVMVYAPQTQFYGFKRPITFDQNKKNVFNLLLWYALKNNINKKNK